MRIDGLGIQYLAAAIDAIARGALGEVRIMVRHREGEQFSGSRNYIVNYIC